MTSQVVIVVTSDQERCLAESKGRGGAGKLKERFVTYALRQRLLVVFATQTSSVQLGFSSSHLGAHAQREKTRG